MSTRAVCDSPGAGGADGAPLFDATEGASAGDGAEADPVSALSSFMELNQAIPASTDS